MNAEGAPPAPDPGPTETAIPVAGHPRAARPGPSGFSGAFGPLLDPATIDRSGLDTAPIIVQGGRRPPPPAGQVPGPLPPLAPWWERWAARAIDTVLYAIGNAVLSAILFTVFGAVLGTRGTGVFATYTLSPDAYYLVSILAWALSGVAFALSDLHLHGRNGQTLGKMLLRIRVAGLDGGPAPRAALVHRAILFPGLFALVGLVAGATPAAATIGLVLVAVLAVGDGIPIITDERSRQSLHDRLAGTVVTKVG